MKMSGLQIAHASQFKQMQLLPSSRISPSVSGMTADRASARFASAMAARSASAAEFFPAWPVAIPVGDSVVNTSGLHEEQASPFLHLQVLHCSAMASQARN